MSIFAYLHITSCKEENDAQQNDIIEYCNKKGFDEVEFIYDKMGRKKSWKDREIKSVLEKAKAHDIIIATDFYNLGSTVIQTLEILEVALKKGVSICIVKDNITIKETRSFDIVNTIRLAQKIEKDFLSMRIKKSLDRERQKGRRLGRPLGQASFLKLDFVRDEIVSLIKKRMPKRAIAKSIGCSPTTLYNWLKREEDR